MRQKLLALFVSGLLSLLIAEMFVRAFAPQNLSGSWRVRAEGMALHRPNWTARHQLGERVVAYRFSGEGFRSTFTGPNEARVRILCLGDSFTFGWLLADQDTYVHQLQERADAEFGAETVGLLNAGHGGWGTSDCVRFVELRGEELAPHGIIVFISADDIGRSLRQPQYKWDQDGRLSPTAPASQTDSALKRVINRVPGYNWLLEHSHLLQLARNAAARTSHRQGSVRGEPVQSPKGVPTLHSPEEADPQAARRLGLALVRHLQAWCAAHHCQLLVLTTGFHRMHGEPTPNSSEPTAAFVADLGDQLSSLGIPFVDISADFDARIGGDYSQVTIPGDGHPNERGAALIAELNWPHVRSFAERILHSSSVR